jgi:electron transfer flavoprotein alpha subunit
MRFVVCVKHVPVLSQLRFDPETRRLVRDGVRGEPSSFDLRALLAAVVLRATHGGEVIAVTMGPPAARESLVHCLALGADRGVHLCDPGLAGSDTLATARALAAVMRREQPDVILLGRSSVDAETGQVGPELAELLDLPQATVVRELTIDPAARTFEAERETDEGTERVAGPLPAVVTAAEDIHEERFPSKADRQAATDKPIEVLTLAGVGLAPGDVGKDGSPTWVAGLEDVKVERRAEVLEGTEPASLATALRERLLALDALGAGAAERPPLPAPAGADGAPIWVVAELGPEGPRGVTAELLTKAAHLAGPLGGRVEAVVIGAGAPHVPSLAAAGAERVLVADGPGLEPYTTEAHARVLADAIRQRAPRIVLLGATVRGRDLAARVAARLGLGLTGDAIDVEVDGEGRVRQMKPAFGGTVVAPVLSNTRPEMATVRPGMLQAARPDPARHAAVERLAVGDVTSRVRVLSSQALDGAPSEALEAAAVVIGVGKGVGGPEALPSIERLAGMLGAAIGATREVTDLGWLPRQLQVGLTGRAIAPRLYLALGASGAMEHMVGLRRAGTIVAVNKSPKAPIHKVADVSIVVDLHAMLPHLEAALRP